MFIETYVISLNSLEKCILAEIIAPSQMLNKFGLIPFACTLGNSHTAFAYYEQRVSFGVLSHNEFSIGICDLKIEQFSIPLLYTYFLIYKR